MKICGACGGDGQDSNCSRAADCSTCGGLGYIRENYSIDPPVIAINDVINLLDNYIDAGKISESKIECIDIRDELQNWMDEA